MIRKQISSLALVLCLCQITVTEAKAVGNFEIISAEGNVSESQDGQNWSKADAETVLEPQDWLKTDRSGMATLLLPDSTQTKIGPNTKIKLIGSPDPQNRSSVALNISTGKVWSRTNRVEVDLKIRIPGATASVRGTEWIAQVDSNGIGSLTVLAGTVEIETRKKTALIETGQVASIDAATGNLSISSVISSDEARQFIYHYKAQPLAYLPKGDAPDWARELIRTYESDNTKFASSIFSTKLRQIITRWTDRNKERMFPVTTADWIAWFELFQAEIAIGLGDETRAKKLIEQSDAKAKGWVAAKHLLTQGRFQDAKRILFEAGNEIVNDGYYWLLLGSIETATGELTRARDLLNVGEREAPSLVDIYLASANVEMRRGKFNRARNYLNAASGLAEPSQEYISLLSRYYVLTGQVQKARSAISSHRTSHRQTTADLALADSLLKLKINDTDGALLSALEATAIDANFSRAQLYQGIGHLHRRETQLAIRRFSDAERLDPLDPMPNLLAAKLFAAEFDFQNSQLEAEKAVRKKVVERSAAEFATDQTGGLNVGRRYYEIGLPQFAISASQHQFNLRDPASHVYEASVSQSDFYSTSQLMRGLSLDSQILGVRRDFPDGVSRNGIRGVVSAEYSQVNETVGRYSSAGLNGYQYSKLGEISWLLEGGTFDQEISDHDKRNITYSDRAVIAAVGWRPKHGHDISLYATVSPFRANVSTQPTDLDENRLSLSYTNTSDDITTIVHAAAQASDLIAKKPAEAPANPFFGISQDFSANCSDETDRRTSGDSVEFSSAIELNNNASIMVDGGYHAIKSFSRIGFVHKEQLHCYEDLDFGDPILHDDLVERLEQSDQFFSLRGMWTVRHGIEIDLFAKLVSTHRTFNDSLTTEYGGPFPDVYTIENINALAGSVKKTESLGGAGLYWASSNGLSSLQLAAIRDRRPLVDASVSPTRIAGITPLYDWLHPDGTAEQISVRATHKLSQYFAITAEHTSADLQNNSIFTDYFAEQQSARQIRRVALDRYRSPLHYQIIYPDRGFEQLSLTSSSLTVEKALTNGFSTSGGVTGWSLSGKDAPMMKTSVPKMATHLGVSIPIKRGMLSTRVIDYRYDNNEPDVIFFVQVKRRFGNRLDINVNAQSSKRDSSFFSIGLQGYL